MKIAAETKEPYRMTKIEASKLPAVEMVMDDGMFIIVLQYLNVKKLLYQPY